MGEHSLYKHIFRCSPSILSMSFAQGPQRMPGFAFRARCAAAQRHRKSPFGLQMVSSYQVVRVRSTGGTQGLVVGVRLAHGFLSKRAPPRLHMRCFRRKLRPGPFLTIARIATATWGYWPVLALTCRGAPA